MTIKNNIAKCYKLANSCTIEKYQKVFFRDGYMMATDGMILVKYQTNFALEGALPADDIKKLKSYICDISTIKMDLEDGSIESMRDELMADAKNFIYTHDRKGFIKFCKMAVDNFKYEKIPQKIVKMKYSDGKIILIYKGLDVKGRATFEASGNKKYMVTYLNLDNLLKILENGRDGLSIYFENGKKAFVFDKQIIMPFYLKGRK